jgi:MoxR-like ATPase
MKSFQVFKGTKDYIVSQELSDVVNVAIALEKPLIIKGEPGTGKTLLAQAIAESLKKELIRWNIKSTTKAQEGLYLYDTVQRLNDSRFNDKDIADIRQYIKLGKLGEAFSRDTTPVLLIDEIDKADIEFPNDLLAELDEMEFYIPETKETIKAKHRPIVIITSNSEKELPDAFLRRCVFHYIEFPDVEMMQDIVKVHIPDIEKELLKQTMAKFYWLREQRGMRKKPSTSELIDWIRGMIRGGIDPRDFEDSIPLPGVLIKKEQDFSHLENVIELKTRR